MAGTWLNPSVGKWEAQEKSMPQKEMRQCPCWWGSQTVTVGIPKCSNGKTFSLCMKKKSKVNFIWRIVDNNYSFLIFFSLFGPILSQIMDEILTGNLKAPWEHKYLRKWASSVSLCWTSPPFPLDFPVREKMSGLIFSLEHDVCLHRNLTP